MTDNKVIAADVIKNIGGSSNVTNYWHCVTRLRFNLADKKKVDMDAIKSIKGVMGAQFSGEQFQVIIGNTVSDVFDEVQSQLGGTGAGAESVEKEGIISKLMDIISGIFTPILPALAGTGLIKGVLALFIAFGWMTTKGSWYQVLYMISDSVFYFLPFFVAITAARKFHTSEFFGLSVAGVLLYPTMVNAYNSVSAGGHVAAIKLFGLLNVPYVNYTSSVIPIILAIWFMSYIHRWVKGWMPDAVTMMFTPMVTLVITIPFTLVVFGPLGNYVGTFLSAIFVWLFAHMSGVAGLILGATLPIIIMTGMHYAFVPVVMSNFKTLGYDRTLLPINFVTNMAQAGAVFAVAVRTKNAETRQLGISTGISALLGITEPAMYGINLKKKKPFYASLAAGGIAGAIVSVLGVKGYVMPGLTGLTAIPAFIKSGNMTNLYIILGGILLSFVLSFIFTLILGFDDDVEKVKDSKSSYRSTVMSSADTAGVPILAPVKGDVEVLSKVNDPTFAQEIMGKGMAIVPTEGEVVSPIDGAVTVLPDTKHAIGIKGNDGTELLVHIGIDTVELGGQYFTSHVSVGDHVNAGDAVVSFDLNAIKKAGYDPTVMVIVTNSDEFKDVLPMNEDGVIFPQEQLLMGIR